MRRKTARPGLRPGPGGPDSPASVAGAPVGVRGPAEREAAAAFEIALAQLGMRFPELSRQERDRPYWFAQPEATPTLGQKIRAKFGLGRAATPEPETRWSEKERSDPRYSALCDAADIYWKHRHLERAWQLLNAGLGLARCDFEEGRNPAGIARLLLFCAQFSYD